MNVIKFFRPKITLLYVIHSLIVITWLKWSVSLGPKVITLSGFHNYCYRLDGLCVSLFWFELKLRSMKIFGNFFNITSSKWEMIMRSNFMRSKFNFFRRTKFYLFMRSNLFINIWQFWSGGRHFDHEIEIQKSIIRNFNLMIDLLVTSTIMRSK